MHSYDEEIDFKGSKKVIGGMVGASLKTNTLFIIGHLWFVYFTDNQQRIFLA